MFEKILTIIVCVSIFGVLFFLYVKRTLKKQLDFYLQKNNKSNKKNIVKN